MTTKHSSQEARLGSLSRVDAHHRLMIAGVAAGISGVVFWGRMDWGKQLIVGWDVFTISYLLLAWASILTAQPKVALKTAGLQHSTRKWIFVFVLGASCASLAAVFVLLRSVADLSEAKAGGPIALGLGTLLLSWTLIHTIFALQYAYLYYCRHAGNEGTALIFPEGKMEPDYLDFAYFSFVIGMTSQVSDVQIGSREIRRWALLHGLIAFTFNIAVLALGINIVSGRL